MSDNDKPEPEQAAHDQTVDDTAAPASEPGAEAASEPEADSQPEAAPRRSGARFAGLALFVSILALLAVLYSIYLDRDVQSDVEQGADSVAAVNDRIASVSDTVAELGTALDNLEAGDSRIAEQLELMQREIDDRQQLLDSLPPRMTNIEQSLAALQGISAGVRSDWLLAEGEYYLQIANAQLQLAGNPYLAAQALRIADERVAEIGDPALTAVRRAIADELAALDAMAELDVEGITLTLGSLARVVATLPLREIVSATGDQSEEVDPDLGGVDRAWASVKNAVTGLVKITGPDETATPLMTPDAVYFLRTNLTLQLQAARLAVLRGEQAVFEQSLDDAANWLEEYFDTGATQVSSALETITEIRANVVAVQKPDISESLRQLRQFQALSEQAQ